MVVVIVRQGQEIDAGREIADFRQLTLQLLPNRRAKARSAVRLNHFIWNDACIPKQRSARMHDQV